MEDTQFRQHCEQPSGCRWAILALTCLGVFGKYFAYDTPAVLSKQLEQQLIPTSMSEVLSQATTVVGIADLNPATPEEEDFNYHYNLLYSFYATPNILLPLFMGAAVDAYGCHWWIVFLGLLVVIGVDMFASGVAESNWTVMLAGRTIFGIGGESLQIAQYCMLFRWFQGQEVSFALGMVISFSRLGLLCNSFCSPAVASRLGMTAAFWLDLVFCCVSFACNVLSVCVDRSYNTKPAVEASSGASPLAGISQLSRTFWLLVAVCVLLTCGVLPFTIVAVSIFEMSSQALPYMYLAPVIGSPIFGGIVDIVGLRSHFLLASSLMLSFCYLTILMTPAWVSMLELGVVYMVFSGSIWPALALAVPEKKVGLAYGIALCFTNAGLALAPLLVSYLELHVNLIYPNREQHLEVVLFFVLLGLAGIVLSLAIHVTNKIQYGVLDMPACQAQRQKLSVESRPLAAKTFHYNSCGNDHRHSDSPPEVGCPRTSRMPLPAGEAQMPAPAG